MDQKQAVSFEEHFRKLELLSQQLQENRIPIDELVPKMKEALVAIRVCKDVLQRTKLQLHEISAEFRELEEEEETKKAGGTSTDSDDLEF